MQSQPGRNVVAVPGMPEREAAEAGPGHQGQRPDPVLPRLQARGHGDDWGRHVPGSAPQVCYSGQLRPGRTVRNRAAIPRIFTRKNGGSLHPRTGAHRGARACMRPHTRREPRRGLTLPPGAESSLSLCGIPRVPSGVRKSPRSKFCKKGRGFQSQRRGKCGGAGAQGCFRAIPGAAMQCPNWAWPAGTKRERGQLLILRSGTRSGEVFSFCAVAALQARCGRFRGIVRIPLRGRRSALRPRRSGARWFPA